MKRSEFTEDQIAFALKQNELGTSVEEVCRKMGISEATFYVWKKKYSGIGPSELRRLRQLEEENRRLKQIVADLSLDKAMLQAVVAKKRSEAFASTRVGARTDAAVRLQRTQRAAHRAHVRLDVSLQAVQARPCACRKRDAEHRGLPENVGTIPGVRVG